LPWWRQGAITAAELQTKQFPPLRFVVPDLIPEGLTLLAGKPKVGKSWMVLDIAIAVASGRYTLGNLKPEQGDVLYLALEDGERRLQRRLTKLLPSFAEEWPRRLLLRTEWKRLNEGGLDAINEWCKSVQKPTLAIVDTIEKIRPLPRQNVTSYSHDYHALAGLQNLANEQNLGIVATTHLRKAEADDRFDTVSGTLGLTAAVDTILVLENRQGTPTLCIRGRDIEEVEKTMRLNQNCKWEILGAAADVARSDSRAKIMAVMKEASEPMRPADIAATTGLVRNHVYQLLHRMGSDGEVVKYHGYYVHPGRQDLLEAFDRKRRKMSDLAKEALEVKRKN
jgi:hypothetical protein